MNLMSESSIIFPNPEKAFGLQFSYEQVNQLVTGCCLKGIHYLEQCNVLTEQNQFENSIRIIRRFTMRMWKLKYSHEKRAEDRMNLLVEELCIAGDFV